MRLTIRNRTGWLTIAFGLLLPWTIGAATPGGDWRTQTTHVRRVDRITYHFPGELGLAERNELIARCRSAIRHNLSLLGATSFSDTIDICFLASRRDMLRYTGMAAAGWRFRIAELCSHWPETRTPPSATSSCT